MTYFILASLIFGNWFPYHLQNSSLVLTLYSKLVIRYCLYGFFSTRFHNIMVQFSTTVSFAQEQLYLPESSCISNNKVIAFKSLLIFHKHRLYDSLKCTKSFIRTKGQFHYAIEQLSH